MAANRILLLCKRALTQDEHDLLEQYMSVTYFNPRVHMSRPLNELVAGSEIVVLHIFDDQIRSYYESGKKLIDPNNVSIILLERHGCKVNPAQVYGERYVRKSLPTIASNKADFIFKMLSNHMPKVDSKWRKFLSCIGKLCS